MVQQRAGEIAGLRAGIAVPLCDTTLTFTPLHAGKKALTIILTQEGTAERIVKHICINESPIDIGPLHLVFGQQTDHETALTEFDTMLVSAAEDVEVSVVIEGRG